MFHGCSFSYFVFFSYLCQNKAKKMNNNRHFILISNDDGYKAKGINALVEMLRDMADILVCAPDSARSGYARAFSATTPLDLTPRHREEGVEVWSSNGTRHSSPYFIDARSTFTSKSSLR